MENTAVLETDNIAAEPVEEQKNELLEAALKRALDEVNALEMTQQILAMVERSLQKPLFKDYNTARVKKYLHELYSLPDESGADEVSGMEFIFWQEVQLWRSALSQRDGFIPIKDFRHYCENSRPPLSDQALLALARFYRGLPGSEKTTSKFDLVITRLFSRDEENGLRRLTDSRLLISQTLGELYRDWLGISPQNVIEDERITQAVADLNEFVYRMNQAQDFESLIADDFIGKILSYKRSLNQVFYAPQVVAVVADCNIRLGNRFIELLEIYRETKKAQGRPPVLVDAALEHTVSETTNRSLKIVFEAQKNYAKQQQDRERQRLLEIETFQLPKSTVVATPRQSKVSSSSGGLLGINKWLLIGGFVAILMSGGLYVWTEYGGNEITSAKSAEKLNEKELPGGEYLTAARVSNGAFFGVVTPKWNTLSEENKKKVLEDLAAAGKDKGYKQVSLLSNEGKMIAQAGDDGIKLF